MNIRTTKCGMCGNEGIRLYRPCSNAFDDSWLRCNAHIPERGRCYWVPAIDGAIRTPHGYSGLTPSLMDSYRRLSDARPWPQHIDGKWYDSADEYMSSWPKKSIPFSNSANGQ